MIRKYSSITGFFIFFDIPILSSLTGLPLACFQSSISYCYGLHRSLNLLIVNLNTFLMFNDSSYSTSSTLYLSHSSYQNSSNPTSVQPLLCEYFLATYLIFRYNKYIIIPLDKKYNATLYNKTLDDDQITNIFPHIGILLHCNRLPRSRVLVRARIPNNPKTINI